MIERTETPSQTPTGPTPSGITSTSGPSRIESVALTVNDLAGVSAFYRDVVGLRVIEASKDRHRLGAGDAVLLELRGDPTAKRANPRQAGLFHTAFLLPARSDLADWLVHARETGTRLQGASDHLVSEALYLADPEGNGIEIYRDRPSETWTRAADGTVAMATNRLDLDALAQEAATAAFDGLPGGTVIGHVHLQVGDLEAAEAFYAGLAGLDVTTRYPGATFFGAGGYHHHIGTNVWNSRGVGPRPDGHTGLAEIALRADPAILTETATRLGITAESSDGTILRDPWGTALRLQPK